MLSSHKAPLAEWFLLAWKDNHVLAPCEQRASVISSTHIQHSLSTPSTTAAHANQTKLVGQSLHCPTFYSLHNIPVQICE